MRLRFIHKTAVLSAVFFFAWQLVLFAAPLTQLKAVRYSSSTEKDRVVFELSGALNYRVFAENDGKRIVVELYNAKDIAKQKPPVKSSQIKTIKYDTTEKDKVRVLIDLTDEAEYIVRTLKNPARVYIDIERNFERESKKTIAPGLIYTEYKRKTGAGRLEAYFLDIDPKKYVMRPVLANGIVPGRATVTKIATANKALAAINASYFALDGTILGYLRLDGTTVGTTYFNRTALGIKKDGSVVVGKLNYHGYVNIGRVQLDLGGVDAERGENSVVLYNKYFGKTTKTNIYGKEFIIRGGIVSRFGTGNSEIPEDGFVISAHGTAKDKLKLIRIGEKVTFTEKLDAIWNGVDYILGAGPLLVSNGAVNVTVDEEQFPSDIRNGRAPRSAFAVKSNGHYLLAVVDGRQSSSIGCTLNEWAELLKNMGAKDALNLDGGGSSEMVIKNKIANSPSDGSERPVGSALVVLPISRK